MDGELYLCRKKNLMLNKLASQLRFFYTWFILLTFRSMGKCVSAGEGTVIMPRAMIVPGAGEISLGKKCYIGPGVVLNAYEGFIRIGDNVSVNYYAVLYGHGGLTIGSDTRIAAHVVIIPSEHAFDDKNVLIRKQQNVSKGITIGKDVWIGTGTKILDGSVIGDGCVIGANSVVKGALEPYGIYVGAPARKIRERT